MSYDFPANPAEDDEYAPPSGGQTYVYKAPRWLVKGIPPSGGGSGGGLDEAPLDGAQYARQNALWTTLNIPAGDWDSITGKPVTFPPTVPIPWTDVSGKPVTFPPSAHGHPESEIAGLVSDLAAKAPISDPVFTGNPTAPTPATADNDTSVATTAFVKAQGYATTTYVDTVDALKAPLASPVLTGNPTAPTPTANDNDTSIATTEFVTGAVTTAVAASDAAQATALAGKVNDTGDTMTGNLTISATAPTFRLDAIGTTGQGVVRWTRDNLIRWFAYMQSGATSDFGIARCDDAGAYIDSPLYFTRSTGLASVIGDPTAALGVATKQYVDAKPSGGVTISDTAPGAPTAGMLWFESTTGSLFLWYTDADGSQWVQINGTSG